jgi:hypothetical protein
LREAQFRSPFPTPLPQDGLNLVFAKNVSLTRQIHSLFPEIRLQLIVIDVARLNPRFHSQNCGGAGRLAIRNAWRNNIETLIDACFWPIRGTKATFKNAFLQFLIGAAYVNQPIPLCR